ncbi:MAG TPA: hypothetical protein VL264_05845 [Gaiella sp.]|nr:hypothetical protein [Gaiella sp.]
MDYYDVERMVDNAAVKLRAEFEEKLRTALEAERVERQDADEALQRIIDSRTAHLA